jgi:hypothetical protein
VTTIGGFTPKENLTFVDQTGLCQIAIRTGGSHRRDYCASWARITHGRSFSPQSALMRTVKKAVFLSQISHAGAQIRALRVGAKRYIVGLRMTRVPRGLPVDTQKKG